MVRPFQDLAKQQMVINWIVICVTMVKTFFCADFLCVGLASLGIGYCAWFILINGPLRAKELDVEVLLQRHCCCFLAGALPVFCLRDHISSEESLMK